MKYDLDHLPDRRPTDSIKWNEYDEDVIPMWVADMDFPVAEPILRSLRSRVDHGVFGYPNYVHPKGDTVTDLQEVLLARMQTRYHWQVQPEELLFLPGVITGLNLPRQDRSSTQIHPVLLILQIPLLSRFPGKSPLTMENVQPERLKSM